MHRDPDQQLGYLLARAADLAHRTWSSALKDVGVNPRQFSMLALLAHEPGLSQAELARRVMITPQSASEALAALRRDGLLVSGEVAPGHAAQLRLTPAGERLLADADPAIAASHRDIFDCLTPGEQALLAELLHRLLAAR